MSASTMPTLNPRSAIAVARFTVTEDLPTPPLPEAIAKTLVSEPGRPNGISRCACPPRSRSWSPDRWSPLITPSSRLTPVTPGTFSSAAVTSRVMVSFNGQPATVSRTFTETAPDASTSTDSTIPSSVIGRRISGSLTVASAALICSRAGEVMPSRVRAPAADGRSGLLVGELVVAPGLLELLHQRSQLRTDVVAGGDLSEGHPERGHPAGQELHVGVRAGVRGAVLLGDHPVPVLLPVLGEQDQRRGVRRLQAQHQREEDEREGVEPHPVGREPVEQ